jgi:hypothetical protein
MDAARLDRFMAQYALRRDEQQVYLRLPTKGANELRPYLGWRWGAPTGQQILGQGFDDWGERGAAFRYIDALKQPLLYSHSLAVRNPLGSEAYAWRSVAELGMGGFPWTRRRRRCLAEYLTFIREMRPLLESDVLILVEEPAYIASAWGNCPQVPCAVICRRVARARSSSTASVAATSAAPIAMRAICQPGMPPVTMACT